MPATPLYQDNIVIVCRAADERKDHRWTSGPFLLFFFFVPAAESVECSTSHGDKRRTAIYRGGTLIGGSA